MLLHVLCGCIKATSDPDLLSLTNLNLQVWLVVAQPHSQLKRCGWQLGAMERTLGCTSPVSCRFSHSRE